MPLKVLHLITDLNSGGAEISLYRLLSGMDRVQFENQVISLIPIGPVGEKIRSLGIPVHSLSMLPGRPTLSGLIHLTGRLRRERPDILQTWLYHADLLGALAAKVAGTKELVWNVRAAYMDMTRYRFLSRLVLRLCAWLSGWPQAVVTNSRSGQTFHSSLGYHPRRWVLIPNGIDTLTFRPDPDARSAIRRELRLSPESFLIGLVARFDPMKDHATFFCAAGLLAPAFPKVHFVLAGDGINPANRQLSERIHAEQLAGKVHLLGYRDDMPRIIAALDLATLSSYGEGFPNTVAEAMACGVPCVVTDVGDAAFLVSDSGIVVPPKDPLALAEGLKKMIAKGPAERSRLGRTARRRIERNFGINQSVLEYQNLYRSLVER